MFWVHQVAGSIPAARTLQSDSMARPFDQLNANELKDLTISCQEETIAALREQVILSRQVGALERHKEWLTQTALLKEQLQTESERQILSRLLNLVRDSLQKSPSAGSLRLITDSDTHCNPQ